MPLVFVALSGGAKSRGARACSLRHVFAPHVSRSPRRVRRRASFGSRGRRSARVGVVRPACASFLCPFYGLPCVLCPPFGLTTVLTVCLGISVAKRGSLRPFPPVAGENGRKAGSWATMRAGSHGLHGLGRPAAEVPAFTFEPSTRQPAQDPTSPAGHTFWPMGWPISRGLFAPHRKLSQGSSTFLEKSGIKLAGRKLSDVGSSSGKRNRIARFRSQSGTWASNVHRIHKEQHYGTCSRHRSGNHQLLHRHA